MNKIWYGIGDFFEATFGIIDSIGNSINYLYIGIITAFLVVWVSKMVKHRRDGEEHAQL